MQPYMTFMTDTAPAMIASTDLGFEKTWRPVRRWNLGLQTNNTQNQVNQIKTAVTAPTSSRGGAGTLGTQGIPQPVQNLRVTRTALSSTQYKVSVSFTPNPSDNYFQGVSVSLNQGNGNPVSVVTGKTSPITFVTTKTPAASAISVASVGSFANTSRPASPGRALALS
jgi:hypothetical protein